MLGVAAFCIAACMLGLPGRVKKLERKIRQKEREEKEKGEIIMSEHCQGQGRLLHGGRLRLARLRA